MSNLFTVTIVLKKTCNNTGTVWAHWVTLGQSAASTSSSWSVLSRSIVSPKQGDTKLQWFHWLEHNLRSYLPLLLRFKQKYRRNKKQIHCVLIRNVIIIWGFFAFIISAVKRRQESREEPWVRADLTWDPTWACLRSEHEEEKPSERRVSKCIQWHEAATDWLRDGQTCGPVTHETQRDRDKNCACNQIPVGSSFSPVCAWTCTAGPAWQRDRAGQAGCEAAPPQFQL